VKAEDLLRSSKSELSSHVPDARRKIEFAMEKTLRKFASKEDARAETYRYWRSRPLSEVLDATAEFSEQMWNRWYEIHGIKPDVERSDRTLTRIQHGRR
jgi:hypothetical protein